jgi:integrase
MGGNLAKWLATYTQKNTRNIYKSSARHFLTCIYGGELDRPDTKYEKLSEKFISECNARKRDYFKDLQDFGVYIGKRPPKTIQTYIYGVKSFIEYSLNIEIPKKQMKVLKKKLPKGKRARTEDGNLTRPRLRNILTHCDDKGKALFLTLASSGIRIGEALQLQPYDIDWTNDPVKVRVRGEITKEGDAYYSFISSEAKEALNEWLKVKDSYLQSAINKGRGLRKLGNGKGKKDINDTRLFPFSMGVANSMWMTAVRKAKLDIRDKSTNRFKFHIHILRKFFQSQMKYANVPEDLVEALIGHSGYLDDAYRRYSFEQIKEKYKQGEPYLLINVPTEIREIQTKFNNEQQKNKQRIDDLTLKLTDSNNLMIKLMSEKDDLAKQVAAQQKILATLLETEDFEKARLIFQEANRLAFQQQKEEDRKQFEKREGF